MNVDFLSETNICGQTLLRLVSRGNAILAELQRLSDHIPPVFLPGSEDRKYESIIFDYRYLSAADALENRIESSADLLDLDEEFKENHLPILERFYLLFESIYKYVKDFVKFLSELQDGVVYIQQTFESVLVNQDGKQLLAEALYLYGVMLMLLDQRIDGLARERMLMSYYRYKGAGQIPNIDEVCKLCRNTGYSSLARKPPPPNYPLEYFARFPLPEVYVSMIIGRLRSDDIYLQTSYYPLPEHRSTALATQASMLYIILYFQPSVLIRDQAVMREIVDKHFPDNWVISYYMGFTVDLSIAWAGYKAAATAIKNTIDIPTIKHYQQYYAKQLKSLIVDINMFLTEGVLVEEYVLDHINKLLGCLRNCNVALRWLILHRTAENKKLKELVCQGVDGEDILLLLVNTAQFEFVMKGMFQGMLEKKQVKWQECKTQGKERMNELAEYFSGEKVLAAKVKDLQLQAWFKDIATKIDELDYHDSTLAGRKIQQLTNALEEVEQFHQIESSLQVKQFLGDTRELLKRMIRYVNIKEEVLVTIATISDISYAWDVINDYVDAMQTRIKKEPSLVIKIRSTFLKLASMLELPLVRITQANSPDLVSVSEFYSSELVNFVRKVLEIIPISMFDILNRIIDLQTNRLIEVPTRLPRVQLREYAQIEERYLLAKATYEVSKFTEGILAMETTLMGIIQIDPKRLLEDGIRKELVRQIARAMDQFLVFKTAKIADFENRLRTLAAKLQGMLRSFEYIQDYVNVYGLKIWQEEFSRIINYNVEQECNSFLKKKVFDWQSDFQSSVIPIPTFPRVDESVNFMGRLVRELLVETDTRKTMYVDQMSGWFDFTGKELVGIRTFSLLHSSVGIFGLTGCDRLLSFMTVTNLQKFVANYRKEMGTDRGIRVNLEQLLGVINPPSALPRDANRHYTAIIAKVSKVWPSFIEAIISIGTTQLIRRHISSELHFSCKLDANPLSAALEAMNLALLEDVHSHYQHPDVRPYPSEDNPILPEVSSYLETAGVCSPFEKIYITTEPLEYISLMLFLFVIAHMPRFVYDPAIDVMTCKKKEDPLDGTPFVVGIITVLKQFHSSHKDLFLAYLGQYVRCQIDILDITKEVKEDLLPSDVSNVLHFLEDFCRLAPLSRKAVESYIPAYLFARFKRK